MNDLERRLVEIGPEAPPEGLDQSVERMIRWATSERRRRSGLRNPVLAATLGCVVGLSVGWGFSLVPAWGSHVATSEATIVIVVDAPPEMMQWFVGDHRAEEAGFFDREHAGLETVYVTGEVKPVVPKTL